MVRGATGKHGEGVLHTSVVNGVGAASRAFAFEIGLGAQLFAQINWNGLTFLDQVLCEARHAR